MSETTRSRFSTALAGVGAGYHATEADELAATVADLVEAPAVGVELPFAPDALAGTNVVTDPRPSQVVAARTGVTPASFGVAETGSVGLPSTDSPIEPVALYPSTHVAVVPESKVVEDLRGGFDRLGGSFAPGTDSVVLATGPSATADMGGLVTGAHGPQTVEVVVVTDR